MKTTLLLAGVAVVALAGPAKAQTVFCANCSELVWDEAHEIWEGVQWAQQLEQQILSVKYAILGWEELIKSNIQLPSRILRDFTGVVTEIQGIAQQASLLGSETHFMIDDLSTGFADGASLENVSATLERDRRALALAMSQLGLSMQRSQDTSADYSAQLAVLEAQEAEGPTQAAQIANQISALRGQQAAADQAAANASWQAMATAELMKRHKEELLEVRVAQNQAEAMIGACTTMTTMAPAICQQWAAGVQTAAAQ